MELHGYFRGAGLFAKEKNVWPGFQFCPTLDRVALNDADMPGKGFGHCKDGDQRAGHRKWAAEAS